MFKKGGPSDTNVRPGEDDAVGMATQAATGDTESELPAIGAAIAQVGLGDSHESSFVIAAQLDITERTARTHVSNILGKLDLASRTQAALWAIEHRIV